ncbi:MAG: non-heme iron oxygenase ferredoxin subunit [Candidatus Dormibacteraeota bacterium]|nr:non-heme iron oxygenase ferredoxin subunit [Candidatus Dormibacteraeota bacterium]
MPDGPSGPVGSPPKRSPSWRRVIPGWPNASPAPCTTSPACRQRGRLRRPRPVPRGWAGRVTSASLQQARLPAPGLRRVLVGELGVCLAHTQDGAWFAIDDTCTHEDCSLSQGDLEDHAVECPCHGSRFDLTTGDVLNLPAVVPVRTHRVTVEGEAVRVEVEDG